MLGVYAGTEAGDAHVGKLTSVVVNVGTRVAGEAGYKYITISNRV